MRLKHVKIYRTNYSSYRVDGMLVYLSTRCVYINLFEHLSACSIVRCPYGGLTCNKCIFSV